MIRKNSIFYFLLALCLLELVPALAGQSLLVLTDGPLSYYRGVLAEIEGELASSVYEEVLAGAEYREYMSRLSPEGQMPGDEGESPGYSLVLALGQASSRLALASFPQTPVLGVSYLYDPAERALWEALLASGRAPRRVVLTDLELERRSSKFAEDFNQPPPVPVTDPVSLSWLFSSAREWITPVGTEARALEADPAQPLLILPSDSLTPEEKEGFFRILDGTGALLVTSSREDLTRPGGAVSYFPRTDRRMGREISLLMEDLLSGAHEPEVPLKILKFSDSLTVNAPTLSSRGTDPPWQTLLLAEFTGMDPRKGLSPEQAAAEALQNDPAYRSAVLDREDQFWSVRTSRSSLLPQVSLFSQMAAIDEDRAESSLSPYEYEGSAGVQASQILWSDGVRTGYGIQKLLLQARKGEAETRRQDTLYAVFRGYYNLSRAMAALEIQKDAVDQTRAYLERSVLLEKIGEDSQLNVYRFENQLARDNQSLIDALSRARGAYLELLHLRGVPTSQARFSPENLPLPGESSELERFVMAFLADADTPARTALLEDIVVSAALGESSSLLSQDSHLEAVEREKAMRSRAFFSPTVLLSGEWAYTFYQGGAGGGSEVSLAPGVSFNSSDLSSSDDFTWSAGLSLSLPLLSGGERAGELKKAEVQVEKARTARQSAADSLALNARNQVTGLLSVYAGLQEGLKAERAAQMALEFTEEAYEKGSVSSYELLDAQTSHTAASLAVTDRKSDFTMALLGVLRVMDKTDAFISLSAARDVREIFSRMSYAGRATGDTK